MNQVSIRTGKYEHIQRSLQTAELLFKDYPDVVGAKELQKMLGIGRNAVYKLLKEKVIASIQIGKNYRIPKAYIVDFLFQNEKFDILIKSELSESGGNNNDR